MGLKLIIYKHQNKTQLEIISSTENTFKSLTS